jgi:branched-chain amino acid transport system ATP-binding protein
LSLVGKDISKRFGGLQALRDVCFEIDKEEIVGLIGPNGAGKSTLFNVITGFMKPEKGRIYYDGKDITALPSHKICRLGIARTFQVPRPFNSLNVFENVLVGASYAAKKYSAKRIDHILEILRLSEIADRHPLMLNPVERKKLVLARALAGDPQILLVDEIAAGLNMSEIKEVENVLLKLHSEHGMAIFLVEHLIRFVVNISDKIIVLDQGEKLIEGKPSEVVSDKRVIRAYLGLEEVSGESDAKS